MDNTQRSPDAAGASPAAQTPSSPAPSGNRAAQHSTDNPTTRSPPRLDIGHAPTTTNGTEPPPRYRLLLPGASPPSSSPLLLLPSSPAPLVICFHGSGEPPSCSPAWDALAASLLARGLRVLLCDRGTTAGLAPGDAARALGEHLLRDSRSEGEGGPYVLVAHSYGGAFARTFLHLWEGRGRERVAGMVLVETGQEGGLDAKIEDAQIRSGALGRRPLVVVRGDSLLGKWRDLERAEAEAEEGMMPGAGLRAQREMLRLCEEEDVRLKRRQLGLVRSASRARFVQVPDCGHNVVRDRPDAVVEAVEWVVGRLGDEDGKAVWWRRVARRVRGLARR